MCGIAGILLPADRRVVEPARRAMADTILCRDRFGARQTIDEVEAFVRDVAEPSP